MCGLVAILSPGVPIRQDLLDALRDRLAHRGPDGARTWIDRQERVGLAHRRLSVIDTSHAADQPMADSSGRFRIVYNGEIYNYLELRDELVSLGHAFRTSSDTEVLLASLVEWGEDAICRLNGMFAFALWDEATRRMLVARDRFGEKPLFVGRGALGTVVFASEMKAILAHPLVALDVSPEAVQCYGQGTWYEDGEGTFFASIARLPPAHAAWFDASGSELRRWRYWTPDYSQVDLGITPRKAVERFSELLDRSIRLRLRSDVPLGSSLSGGLDSSAIVGALALGGQSLKGRVHTFTASFPDDPTISENREVESVVRHTGVSSHLVTPEPAALAAESALLHWHQEEPFLSASIYLQWCVARLARSESTTVLLDGQGADELLAGYQYYFRQRQLDLVDRGELRLAQRETAKFTRRLVQAAGRFHEASRRFDAHVAYAESELAAFKSSPPSVAHMAYRTGVAPAVPGGRLRRTLSEALQYNSLPMLLRYADRNSMAFARETRLPFLDHDLVGFCISLPDAMLVRNGWQKWILRASVGRLVPKDIRWRADKVGYAAPLDKWLRKELKDWAADRIFDTHLADVPGYDRVAVSDAWHAHQEGNVNRSWAIWRWISMSEWLNLLRSGYWRSGRPSSGFEAGN